MRKQLKIALVLTSSLMVSIMYWNHSKNLERESLLNQQSSKLESSAPTGTATLSKTAGSIDGNDTEFSDSLATWDKIRYVNIPKITNRITNHSPKSETEWLATNIFFEAANQPIKGKELVAWSTVNRIGNFGNNTLVAAITNAKRTSNGKMLVQDKCHFSWYCDGSDKTIPNDKESMKAWNESIKVASSVLKEYKEKKTKYKYDHYCTLKVEKKTDWVKYMKTGTRYVCGDHVFYVHDKKKFDENWKKVASS